MKKLRHSQTENREKIFRWACLVLLSLVIILGGGCSIWNANLAPNYKSNRADRLCHPYGQCSQGTWVGHSGVEQDPTLAKRQCEEVVAQRYGNGEWEDSVAKGLEVGRCMEKKGYKLQQ